MPEAREVGERMSKLKLIGIGIHVVAFAAIYALWHQNGVLRERVGMFKTELEQAQAVADANLDAFNKVDALQKQCVAGRQADVQANKVTVDQLQSDLMTVSTRAQQVRVVRQEIFRDPTCKELAAIDVAAQCPAWANELRFSAQAINTGAGAGGAGPGADPTARRVLSDLSAFLRSR